MLATCFLRRVNYLQLLQKKQCLISLKSTNLVLSRRSIVSSDPDALLFEKKSERDSNSHDRYPQKRRTFERDFNDRGHDRFRSEGRERNRDDNDGYPQKRRTFERDFNDRGHDRFRSEGRERNRDDNDGYPQKRRTFERDFNDRGHDRFRSEGRERNRDDNDGYPQKRRTFERDFNDRGHDRFRSEGRERNWDDNDGFRSRGRPYNTRKMNDGKEDSFSSFGSSMATPDFSKLPPVRREFYVEHPNVTQRSEKEIQAFREKHEMKLNSRTIKVPRPITSFEETPFPEQMRAEMTRTWGEPTAIQSQGWPVVLSGHDCVGIARTGSGKTAVFVMPAIVHILGQENIKRELHQPMALVLVPTRELCQQVHHVSLHFCRAARLKVNCVYGGESRDRQMMNLDRGTDILIACPGRLTDFMQSGILDMKLCSYVVLDEADRMLDMGFEPQIKKVLHQVRPDHQTVMFSATWPKEVHSLANEFMGEYVRMTMGSEELTANPNITQLVRICEPHTKLKELQMLFDEISVQAERKTLVFTETKSEADMLYRGMKRAGFPVTVMHGDKQQGHRTQTMKDFKSGVSEVMIATDVAGRGIDVSDIKFVINYSVPKNIENYVHRIGRTARGNSTGTSYTLVTRDTMPNLLKDLADIIEQTGQPVPDELIELIGFRSKRSDRSKEPGQRRSWPGGQKFDSR